MLPAIAGNDIWDPGITNIVSDSIAHKMRKINFNHIDHKAPNMNRELVEKGRAIIKGNISNSTQMISGVLQALLSVTLLVDTFINDV